jgi:glycosyltransferase involved in cell wall biosynthesis
VAVVGRDPSPRVRRLAEGDARVQVTGTVPDIRPYLWGARLSIVPLRIGGGTRLKIYESFAAGLPVVSTRVGAEGLPLEAGRHLAIADTPALFAGHCLRLLDDAAERRGMARAAYELVAARFSWEAVSERFEEILQRGPRPC